MFGLTLPSHYESELVWYHSTRKRVVNVEHENVEGMKRWKLEMLVESSLAENSYDSKGNCSLVFTSDSTSIVSHKQRTKYCPGNRK